MISRRTSPSIGRRLFLVGFLICRNTSGRGHHSSSSRWRQTRDKRKKALPVRKLLELERAQQKVRSLNSRQWETDAVVRVPRHRQHPQRAQQLRTEIPFSRRPSSSSPSPTAPSLDKTFCSWPWPSRSSRQRRTNRRIWSSTSKWAATAPISST